MAFVPNASLSNSVYAAAMVGQFIFPAQVIKVALANGQLLSRQEIAGVILAPGVVVADGLVPLLPPPLPAPAVPLAPVANPVANLHAALGVAIAALGGVHADVAVGTLQEVMPDAHAALVPFLAAPAPPVFAFLPPVIVRLIAALPPAVAHLGNVHPAVANLTTALRGVLPSLVELSPTAIACGVHAAGFHGRHIFSPDIASLCLASAEVLVTPQIAVLVLTQHVGVVPFDPIVLDGPVSPLVFFCCCCCLVTDFLF
jgi:hypothetical protein